jgi:hypothetical protein
MPKKRKPSGKSPARVREPKVAMSYRLSPAKIARAQALLGTPTATATIEEALDAIIFRRELMEGIERASGLPIVEAFPDDTGGRRR